MTDPKPTNSSTWAELAVVFLKLGTTAFGGPAAHIALMEQEFVRKRRWLSHAEFLDLLGTANLIPGPSSTELAIFIGHRRAGWIGLLLGGLCFILPAMLLVMGLAWAYVRYGSLPQVAGVLYGVKPVIIAVILQALWRLGQTAIKSRFLALCGMVSVGLSLWGIDPLLLLLSIGLVMVIRQSLNQSGGSAVSCFIPWLANPPLALTATAATTLAAPFGLGPLFLFFLKVGAVVFGSGYVLLAFLRQDLVENWHWLTNTQLLDAIAVGQVTPGPVFTTATFIGYLLAGSPGAVVATAGIFLPSFLLVAISGPLVPRLRRSPLAGAFLDGVNVASLALMGVVSWRLGSAAVVDPTTLLLGLISALLLLRYQLNTAWLVLGGALVGLIVS